jgi:hypothetical protein
MRRLLSLLAVMATALGFTVLSSGPAAALGGETLGCRIAPAVGVPPFTPFCHNTDYVTGTYSVGFQLAGLSGSYTVAWTVPAGYTPVSGTCVNTSGCDFLVSSSQDHTLQVSVTLAQGGASETLASHAQINAVCGHMLC